MKRVFLVMSLLCVAVFAGRPASADAPVAKVKLKGAEERKNPRNFSRDAMTIDEIIRLEEDEGYEDWKRQQEKAERQREAAVEEVLQARAAYEASLERARLEFIKERDARKGEQARREAERVRDFRRHMAEKRKRRQAQEEARIAYAQEQEVQRARIEARTLARLQKIYGTNRMPATVQLEREAYRYPEDRPKSPVHPTK